MIKAVDVVIITARISFSCKNTYKTISDITIPRIMEGPPGLAIIIFPFLFTSLTVRSLFSKNLVNKGVMKNTVKKAIRLEMIARRKSSVNI